MKTKQVKISFIITDYNLPISLLRECIESILALNINADEREIILVDDGSEISPEAGLKDFLSEIKIISQENQGLSAARNAGVLASEGEYIQFVDGDDCLLPDYNDCLQSVFENRYDMLFFGSVADKAASLPGKTKQIGTGVEYLLQRNLRASACGFVFKKHLLGDDLKFTKGILHEDEEFTPLLTLRAQNVAEYSGSVYFYRVRENSIVHSVDTEHIQRRINDFIGVIVRLHEELTALDSIEQRALNRRIDQLSMDLVYNVILLTGDQNKIQETLAHLHSKGINPLPVRLHTLKYFVFSVLCKTRIGRKLIYSIVKSKSNN